ncbi:hypothetical protein D7Z54_01150 [Salibacterium salarium]|uniref:Uncharacterized protein n=1 Tax=Salibacterium salarium TaxID=284579 RepID=A0A428NA55_9BACI|nr:hypothetical protein [Salibacterium salarium]RSL35210.1 hypothetical protein D7Z54_01150 [Salibacterium salarium]
MTSVFQCQTIEPEVTWFINENKVYVNKDIVLESMNEGFLTALIFALYTNSAGNPDWLRTNRRVNAMVRNVSSFAGDRNLGGAW